MPENKNPKLEEKEPDEQMDDLTPEKDVKGGSRPNPNAQKKEIVGQ